MSPQAGSAALHFFSTAGRQPDRSKSPTTRRFDCPGSLLYIFVEMANQTQISAYISKTTKSLVEEYTEHHGVKKAHLVEEALLHHIQALRELPADLVIPPRVVVSRESGESILEKIERPRRPTKAIRELLSSK